MPETTIDREEWISLALEEYESMLLSYAYNLTRDYEKAQDIVQDTFLSLCKADMGKVAFLKAWLFKVCRNRALEIIRKEKERSLGRWRNEVIISSVASIVSSIFFSITFLRDIRSLFDNFLIFFFSFAFSL